MKPGIMRVIMCLFVPLLLLSCGKSIDHSITVQSEEEQVATTVLDFWTMSLSPLFDDYMEERIETFQKIYPHLSIRWTDVPFSAMESKLPTFIAGGKSPDVVNLNTGMALTMVAKNALLDLSSVTTPEQKAVYFEKLYRSTAIGDSVYAYPWYAAPPVMMYNQSIMEEAGLDPDRPPTTLDELKLYAQIIKSTTGKYAFTYNLSKMQIDIYFSGTPIVNEDKTIVKVNTPAALQWVKFVKSLYDEKLVPVDGLHADSDYVVQKYLDEEIAMMLGGSQYLKRIKDRSIEIYQKTRVSEVPEVGGDGNYQSAIMNMAVPAMSDAAEEAALFARFMTNDESQLAFSKIVNIFPSTKRAARDDYFRQEGDDPEAKARVIMAASLHRAEEFTLGIKDEQKILDKLMTELQRVLFGELTPEEALARAEIEMQIVLDEIRAK